MGFRPPMNPPKPRIALTVAILMVACTAWPSLADASARTCRAPTSVSDFWQRMDALCAQLARLQQSPLLPADKQALTAYCTGRVPPHFASRPEAERSAVLARIAAASGLPEPTPGWRSLPYQRSVLVEAAARGLGGDRDITMGPVGNFAVEQVKEELCRATQLPRWFPATCDRYHDEQALLELRKRLVTDLLGLPFLWVRDNRLLERGSRAAAAMRLTAAVFDTVLASVEIAHLAKRMINDVASVSPQRLQDPCTATLLSSGLLRSRESEPPVVTHARRWIAMPATRSFQDRDPMARAGRVLLAIVTDDATPRQSGAHYVRLVERELGRQLHSSEHALVAELVDAIRDYQRVQKLVAERGAPDRLLAELADRIFTVVEAAASMALRDRITVPPGARAALRAVAYRDLSGAVHQVFVIPRQLGLPAVPSYLLRPVARFVRVATTRDQSSLREVMQDMLLPFGPWTEPILFDLNVGAFDLGSGNTRLAGDVGLGYDGFAWGVVARGQAGYYDLRSDDGRLVSETTKRGGGADAWATFELSKIWLLEVRGGAAARIDESDARTIADEVELTTTESRFYRATGLLGLRYEPGFTGAAGLWLGGGVQRQEYQPFVKRVDVATKERLGSTLSRTTDHRVMGRGRFRMQYALVPLWLVLRSRANLFIYDIRTASFSVDIGTSTWTLDKANAKATQVELETRLFLDFERLRFFEFVPSMWVGLDHVRRDDGATVLSTTIPAYGAGLRSDVL